MMRRRTSNELFSTGICICHMRYDLQLINLFPFRGMLVPCFSFL